MAKTKSKPRFYFSAQKAKALKKPGSEKKPAKKK